MRDGNWAIITRTLGMASVANAVRRIVSANLPRCRTRRAVHAGDDRISRSLYRLAGFRVPSTGRQSFVGLGNYSKLIADSEFGTGRVTLRFISSLARNLSGRLACAAAVSRQAAAGFRPLLVHFTV
jgi:hypothetical protein